MYKLTCLNCNTSFSSKRPQTKFCSGKCRVAYSRKGPQDEIEKAESVLEEKVESITGKKMVRAIMDLIENRRKLLKGFEPYCVFFLGETIVRIGLKDVVVGNMKYKLKAPKK